MKQETLLCTSCKQGELCSSRLEPLLPCRECDNCGGHWLLLADYKHWLKYSDIVEGPPDGENFEVTAGDTDRALLCPVSKTIMLKYSISAESHHHLDLSTAVKGVWFDRGEWQLLKEAGLSRKLNEIFTESWQQQIRDQKSRQKFIDMYTRKFGEENYQKVTEIRQWLDQQQERESLVAYLAAEDPYSGK